MLPVKILTNRIRLQLHDKQATEYDDDEILFCLNAGVRFIRRTIISTRPELLMDVQTGKLKSGCNQIKLDTNFISIVDVRANGKSLEVTSPICIQNILEEAKQPAAYYITGFNSVVLYPSPTEDIIYNVFFVPDSKEICDCQCSDSPLPNDFDDALMEYVIIRLSMGNEFDMSQETSVMQIIVNQVETIIANFPDPQHIVTGYWCCGKGDCIDKTGW